MFRDKFSSKSFLCNSATICSTHPKICKVMFYFLCVMMKECLLCCVIFSFLCMQKLYSEYIIIVCVVCSKEKKKENPECNFHWFLPL